MTFIDLFAGIGGIRLACENVGGKCVFSSECDKYAQKTYESNFGEKPKGDITQINAKDIPDHDLLCAGFPCQPFSIAGLKKGFEDVRGGLFGDIIRILQYKKPKAFLLENVKNLVSMDGGRLWQSMAYALDFAGYNFTYKICNAKHYVPQNRERVFVVGFHKSFEGIDFQFPVPPGLKLKAQDILESSVDKKYTLSDKMWECLKQHKLKHESKGNGFGYGLIDFQGITRTIKSRYYKDGSEALVPQPKQNPRRLTPRECARLQGFPDDFVIPVSDTQAYKQFGNSVVVPLVEDIVKMIMQKVGKMNILKKTIILIEFYKKQIKELRDTNWQILNAAQLGETSQKLEVAKIELQTQEKKLIGLTENA